LQVTRRIGIHLDRQRKRTSVGHFSLQIPGSQPLKIEIGSNSLPTSREHLRVYYGDYLGVAPAKEPTFADDARATIDCEDWFEWMRCANPRTRVDAYPLLLVCKDLLDRFVRRELTLISRRTEELAAALARAESTISEQEQELSSLRRLLDTESSAPVDKVPRPTDRSLQHSPLHRQSRRRRRAGRGEADGQYASWHSSDQGYQGKNP
jgi:hypothetical protein